MFLRHSSALARIQPAPSRIISSPIRRNNRTAVLPSARHDQPHRSVSRRASAKSSKKKQQNVGRWDPWERKAFLRGLRKYGRGKWKKISKLIPSRDTIQVKTHAQVMLKKLDEGQNIFEELDRREQPENSSLAQNTNGSYKTVYRLSQGTFQVSRHEMMAAHSLLELSQGANVMSSWK